jgi:DNA-binding transcriptional LysR family regulator
MAIELTDLRVFLAVVEHGSFSRAASALVMTQPSVSERVAGLERSVGTALFDRSTRGAVATAAGTRFAARARRCVELADEAVADALEEARTPRLRVAVHGAFAARAVPLVTEVADALGCRLDVRDVHTEEAQHLVLDQLADVGFVAPGPVPRGLQVLALPADPVVCVAHPAHPLTSRPALRVADLAGATVALNAWGDGASAFVRALEAAPIRPSALRHLSDARAAALLALDHAHVAVVTRSTVAHELGSGALVVLPVRDLGRWDVPLALTYRAARAKEPVVRAVIDAVHRQTRRRRSS